MTIGSMLAGKKPLVTVTRAETVRDIAQLLYEHRIGAVLVVEDGEILGIVSERDIVAALHVHQDVLDCTAGAIMTSPVITVPPGQRVVAAMAVMTDRRVRHLPVVEGTRCLGLISIGDLVKRRIEDAERETSELKDYIQTA
ncbi:CBS domain-containing protein [Sphingosinicellaceae bacterium]|nr:CBS domain-containing protein [Sphingosinicellaceae bacterium]